MAMERRVSLRPRLEQAALLLSGADTVADIGCDHGKLCVALAQRGLCRCCIAVDVSSDSLQKFRRLCALTGLEARVEPRLGDGLEALSTGEADALAILGMGGTLIADILENAKPPLKGAGYAVLSPMRSPEDLRRYLYEKKYFIRDDCIVRDGGRLYQLFSATCSPGNGHQPMPEGWPADCFEIGFRSYEQNAPLLGELVRLRLRSHHGRMLLAKGSAGEKILAKAIKNMEQVLRLLEERA